MDPVTSSQCRRAFGWTLICSVPLALGLWMLLLGWRQGLDLALGFLVQVAVAFATMFAAGWLAVPHWGPRCAARPLLAGTAAVGIFLVGALAGSSASMLLYKDFDLEAWLLRPMIWVSFGGVVPAFLVGILGGRLTRRLLKLKVSRPA